MFKKIVTALSKVVQVVLVAPIALPGKMMNIIKYIGLGLGIIESVIDQEEDRSGDEDSKKRAHEQVSKEAAVTPGSQTEFTVSRILTEKEPHDERK